MLLHYVWVLLILIILEGILAIDNAIILAFFIKNLPEHEQKKN
nr:hypothetical protein [Bacillus thuringiensis]